MESDKPTPETTFEESLCSLQEIVAELEDGEIGLDESLQRFETGVALLRSCYQILEQAEQKIEILTGVDAEGNPVTEPFDASATVERSKGTAGKRQKRASAKSLSAEEQDEDEIQDGQDQRLF